MMTSGEYAYDLLKRLQRNFRCTDSGQRMYLYNFFGEIFNDPSVKITHEAYTAFCNQMDEDAALYAQEGLTSLESIYHSNHFNESFALLQKSFGKIGINVEYGSDTSKGWIKFTLPNGKVKTIYSNQGLSNSYLCARTGAEYEYAKQTIPYYDMHYDRLLDLTETPTNVAGYGAYWEHDGSGEISISGNGSLASSTLFYALGIRDSVETFIVGSGINRLLKESLYFPVESINIVFLHGAADYIDIDDNFSGTSTLEEKQYRYNVYTDCEAIKQASFQPNIAVTFIPLSDWDG